MASPYDQSLLASAPVATKAQMQDGYNPDILNEKPVAPTPPASNSRQDLSNAPQPPDGAYESQSPAPYRKLPFYRTRKGIIIIIAVLLVIVIAAAVGGGVGGSHKKKTVNAAADKGAGGTSTGVTPTATGGVGVGGGGSTTATGGVGVGAGGTSVAPGPTGTARSPGNPITTESGVPPPQEIEAGVGF